MASKSNKSSVIVLDLDPRTLLPSEDNRKVDEESKEFKDLVLSIRTIGVRQPIMATAEKNRKGETVYRIRAGHRRTLAAIKGLVDDIAASAVAGKPLETRCDTVPVCVTGGEWGDEISAVENLHKRALTTGERIRLFEGLKAKGWAHEKIADSVGESRSAITNMLGISARLAKPLQDLLAKHDSLPISKLLKVGGLPKDDQVAAWEALDGVPKPSDKGKATAGETATRERAAKAVMVITVRADGSIETQIRNQEGGTPGQEDKPESWSVPKAGDKAGTWERAGVEITVRRMGAKGRAK